MTGGGASSARTLHHVGVVVADLDAAAKAYEQDFGYRREGGIVEDPVQKVRILFLVDRSASVRLELLQPAGPDSPVLKALQKGGGLNHLCYEVADIAAEVAAFRQAGAVLVSGPVPAPAIGGSRVAFLFHRTHGVFELVESPARIPPAPAG